MRTSILSITIAAWGCLHCYSQTTNAVGAAPDPYLPKLRSIETNVVTGMKGVVYRFSEEQLVRMARTKLETNRLVAYLEQKWPVERLKSYCTSKNVFPERYQNLVALRCPVETELHKGKAHGFDRIWVYASEDDGHATYFEESGSKWHRWNYSINMTRGKRRWVIIEQLPNDFVDSSRYDPK